MAKFEVKVVKIDDVIDHPNADRLTVVKIGGYTCIANKKEDGSWRYHTGDLVAYIPVNSILPEWLLKRLDMWNEEKGIGYLNGKLGNRVNAIKLRGTFSEGILFPIDYNVSRGGSWSITHDGNDTEVIVGSDVADLLGITKYNPVVPTSMSGEVFNLGHSPVKFDLESIEKYPDLFQLGEPVHITEKLHGTFFGLTILTDYGSEVDLPEAFQGPLGRNVLVYSKGLGQKGLMFKDNEKNANNVYVQAWKQLGNESFWNWYNDIIRGAEYTFDAIHILGEVYGKGIQDLTYGNDQKELRIFAIGHTVDYETLWACQDSVTDHVQKMGAQRVPLLHSGKFHPDLINEFRDGNTTLGGGHIREGIVINSMGRVDPVFGNVMLKAVSSKYKLRKGGTEFN